VTRRRARLADEPTAALDSQRTRIVMDLLRRVAIAQRAAIVTVTHDEEVSDRFDRLLQLRDGVLEPDAAKGAAVAFANERVWGAAAIRAVAV
jgi:putative ABC transport system ATP-binding protein